MTRNPGIREWALLALFVVVLALAVLFVETRTASADDGPYGSLVWTIYVPTDGDPHDPTVVEYAKSQDQGESLVVVNPMDGGPALVLHEEQFAWASLAGSRDEYVDRLHQAIGQNRMRYTPPQPTPEIAP